MIRIEQDTDGDFFVVDGYGEFVEQINSQGMAEVIDAATGCNYFAHEVGEQIHLLNPKAHATVVRLAELLIQEIAAKSWR